MDLTSIIGLVGAIIVVVLTIILEGGSPAELISSPTAILITVGGSLIASIYSTPLSIVTSLPKWFIIAFTERSKFNFIGMIEIISTMADKARREGLLALEEETKNITDEFLSTGINMVIDGVDPHQIHEILQNSIDQMAARHKKGAGFFATAGGFSPTFGIIGTVMGLMGVLQDMSNPDTMAKKIATAFLATLWGLLAANLVYMPTSSKLKEKSAIEVSYRHMLMEGILAIQAGENPRVIRDKLAPYVPPSVMAKAVAAGGGAAAKGEAEA
jgi:chemotaxis protein MotA